MKFNVKFKWETRIIIFHIYFIFEIFLKVGKYNWIEYERKGLLISYFFQSFSIILSSENITKPHWFSIMEQV